jgi:hypothetical protein
MNNDPPFSSCVDIEAAAQRIDGAAICMGDALDLATVLSGRLPIKGRTICVVCSDGNVDREVFRAALVTPVQRAA